MIKVNDREDVADHLGRGARRRKRERDVVAGEQQQVLDAVFDVEAGESHAQHQPCCLFARRIVDMLLLLSGERVFGGCRLALVARLRSGAVLRAAHFRRGLRRFGE